MENSDLRPQKQKAKVDREFKLTSFAIKNRTSVIVLTFIIVFIGVFALNVTMMVDKFLDIGKWENISTLVPGFVCIMMAIPMYMGIKKINEELKNR